MKPWNMAFQADSSGCAVLGCGPRVGDSCDSWLMARHAQWCRGRGVCNFPRNRLERRERASALRSHASVRKGPRESPGRANVSRETQRSASAVVVILAHARGGQRDLHVQVITARCSIRGSPLEVRGRRVLRVASCGTVDRRRPLSTAIQLRVQPRRTSAMSRVSHETRRSVSPTVGRSVAHVTRSAGSHEWARLRARAVLQRDAVSWAPGVCGCSGK